MKRTVKRAVKASALGVRVSQAKLLVLLLVMCLLCGCSNKVEEGAELLEKKDFEGAVQVFEQVLEEGKSTSVQKAEAYRGLGMAYYELGQYDKVREYLEKAVEAGGEATPALYNMIGVSAMRQEDYTAALSAFEEGIKLPEVGALEEQGTFPWQKEKVTVDYSEVIREMRYNRIVCHEKLYDWQQAYLAAKEYLEYYPDDARVAHEAEFLETR